MDSFKYPSLDLDRPTFRLLRLFGGQGSVIECEIFDSVTCKKNAVIPYEALSYTWGLNEMTETIVVNGQSLGVTINLHLALNALRHPYSDRILWVDAICIDQHNAKERNHQVHQMAAIYKNADAVIFWLGQGTYATNVALESLRSFEDICASVACRSWKRTDERWQLLWTGVQSRLSKRYSDLVQTQREGIKDLLERPWFERIWIVQEVANSKRGVVCCGTKSVSARIFALSSLIFGIKPSDHAQAILDIMPGPSRHDSWWNQKQDLYTLLRKFRSSKCQDPRDMIYGLLGIASDPGLDEFLRPDYEKSERELIKDSISYLCHLDIDSLPDDVDGYWNAMVDDQSMAGFLRTIDSLYTAAMDHYLRAPGGDRAMDFVFRRGQDIPLTESLLRLVKPPTDENTSAESTIAIQLLIKTHGDQDMLETAARSWSSLEWITCLLTTSADKVHVTESVMVAATKHWKAGSVMDVLLREGGEEVRITDRILRAAAGSLYAKDALSALIKFRGDEIRITAELVKTLRENDSPQARGALELLLPLIEYYVPLRDEAIRAAEEKARDNIE